MNKIFTLTLSLVVVIWAGSVMAHPMQWSSSIGGNNQRDTAHAVGSYLAAITSETSEAKNNFILDLLKTLDSSRYWLGEHQVTSQATGKASWVPDEPDNGIGGRQYYLHYWPRDVLRDDLGNKRDTTGNFFATNPIPEPATMLLLGVGLFGYARTQLKKKNK